MTRDTIDPLEDLLVEQLKTRGEIRPAVRRRSALFGLVLALALTGAGGLGGFLLRPIVTPADERPRFVLLLEDPRDATRLSRPEHLLRAKEYGNWIRSAGNSGAIGEIVGDPLIGTNVFGTTASSGSGGTIVGYFTFTATDLAAAQRLAATTPHLRHGGGARLFAVRQD